MLKYVIYKVMIKKGKDIGFWISLSIMLTIIVEIETGEWISSSFRSQYQNGFT